MLLVITSYFVTSLLDWINELDDFLSMCQCKASV